MQLSTHRLFVLILFTALFVMATREISDPDFWWHLRTGKYIVETGTIPHSDIFSFTNAGKEWVTHEWLSEVVIYVLYGLGSFGLLIVTFAAIITATFAIVYAVCSGKPFIAGFVILLGSLATGPTWGVRPQMLSMLLTSLFLFLLSRYQAAGKIKYITALPPLTLLWVNLHSGFALGLGIIGIYLVGGFLSGVFHLWQNTQTGPGSGGALSQPLLSPRALRNLFLIFILCIAVVLVNPNGARMYSYPFETLTSRAMQTYIQEWFSPDFHSPEFQPFALLLIATLTVALMARAPISITEILLLAISGYAALRSARNIPIFALVAIPVLSQQLANLPLPRKGKERGQSTLPSAMPIVNMGLLVVILLAASARVATVIGNQSNVERAKFPATAVDFISNQELPPNLYNAYGWGGYLIWRLYPDFRVYIDGRADVYGDVFIEQDFLKIYRAETGWNEQLAAKDIRTVLVEPESPIALALASNATWQQVFRDNQSIVFERK